MSQSAEHALRNTIVSRSTVSKKINALKGSINEKLDRDSSCYLILLKKIID
mgnify:CR=1 FL=1